MHIREGFTLGRKEFHSSNYTDKLLFHESVSNYDRGYSRRWIRRLRFTKF